MPRVCAQLNKPLEAPPPAVPSPTQHTAAHAVGRVYRGATVSAPCPHLDRRTLRLRCLAPERHPHSPRRRVDESHLPLGELGAVRLAVHGAQVAALHEPGERERGVWEVREVRGIRELRCAIAQACCAALYSRELTRWRRTAAKQLRDFPGLQMTEEERPQSVRQRHRGFLAPL